MPEDLDKTEGDIAAFLLSVGFSTDPDPPAMTNQAPELDELEEKIGEIPNFGGIPYPFFSPAITTQAPEPDDPYEETGEIPEFDSNVFIDNHQSGTRALLAE